MSFFRRKEIHTFIGSNGKHIKVILEAWSQSTIDEFVQLIKDSKKTLVSSIKDLKEYCYDGKGTDKGS